MRDQAPRHGPVASKPSVLQAVLRRVTLLVLPEDYHGTFHVLRVRGCATVALLGVAVAVMAFGTSLVALRLPVLPALLIATWLAAEVWFYLCKYLPRCAIVLRRIVAHAGAVRCCCLHPCSMHCN